VVVSACYAGGFIDYVQGRFAARHRCVATGSRFVSDVPTKLVLFSPISSPPTSRCRCPEAIRSNGVRRRETGPGMGSENQAIGGQDSESGSFSQCPTTLQRRYLQRAQRAAEVALEFAGRAARSRREPPPRTRALFARARPQRRAIVHQPGEVELRQSDQGYPRPPAAHRLSAHGLRFLFSRPSADLSQRGRQFVCRAWSTRVCSRDVEYAARPGRCFDVAAYCRCRAASITSSPAHWIRRAWVWFRWS